MMWSRRHDLLCSVVSYRVFMLEGAVDISWEVRKLRPTKPQDHVHATHGSHGRIHTARCTTPMEFTMTHSEVMQVMDQRETGSTGSVTGDTAVFMLGDHRLGSEIWRRCTCPRPSLCCIAGARQVEATADSDLTVAWCCPFLDMLNFFGKEGMEKRTHYLV